MGDWRWRHHSLTIIGYRSKAKLTSCYLFCSRVGAAPPPYAAAR